MLNSPHSVESPPAFWKSKVGIAIGMLLVIGLFYLAREHYGHISQLLPYLILLLCPLMHLFGHHHGGQHQHRDAGQPPRDGDRS